MLVLNKNVFHAYVGICKKNNTTRETPAKKHFIHNGNYRTFKANIAINIISLEGFMFFILKV